MSDFTTESTEARSFRGKAKQRPPAGKFLPYQVRWIEDDSQLKLIEKSRQIGMTWATGYRCVEQVSMAAALHDIWVSSRDALQAKLFIDDCRGWAKILHTAARYLGEQVVDQDKHNAFVLSFANSHAINSLSSNPNAQAGKRGTRVLDEFALHPDPRQLYAIALPGITWGGQLEIISTHRGSQNLFAELVEEAKHGENSKGISLHTVTLQDALEEGFLYKLQLKLSESDPRLQMDEGDYESHVRAQCVDEESWLQEFCCIPSDDATAFITAEMIAGATYRYPESQNWQKTVHELADSDRDLYLGVDVGRDHDLTVMWLCAKEGDVYHTRHLVEIKGEKFSAQEAVLYELLGLPRLRRCCIDASGIGRQFAERAQERFGPYKVEAVTFSLPVKEELAWPVRSAFEDKSVRIPPGKKIEADLRAIRREYTASGNVRFAADRGPNGHADRFWALALCLHAGKTSSGPSIVVPLDREHIPTNPRRNW